MHLTPRRATLILTDDFQTTGQRPSHRPLYTKDPPMFRMIRLVFLLSVGFYGGFKFYEAQARGACTKATGVWADNICTGVEATR